MVFAKATTDGIRVSGFLENPAWVLVTCTSITGDTWVIPLECDHRGYFTEDVVVKDFQVMDVIGIPILKTRRTLYVSRYVRNADDIVAWFNAQGVETVPPEDMHVTLAYSKRRVDWEAVGEEQDGCIELEPSLRRSVMPLGTQGATVLTIDSKVLHDRWNAFLKSGATWDYPEYQPHITISYSNQIDPSRLAPFPGRITLGPEKFAEVNEDFEVPTRV
jgi:hypothetical protein